MRVPDWLQVDTLFDGPNEVEPEGIWLRGGCLELIGAVLAARVPVIDAARDVPGKVPPLALRLARELKITEVTLVRGSVVLPGVARLERPTGGQTEPPAFADLVQPFLQGEPRAKFAVNARLFAQTAAAIGADRGVVVEFRGANRPLLIYPNVAGALTEAVLMPMRISR